MYELKPSKAAYFSSLALELDSQSQRVRQLIGSAHWGHDGRHKELLLADIIRRHCPPSVLVSTGFVVSPNNLEVRSLEQDIIVLDASKEAPLFHQGGLVVAFAHTVLATISVKSTMDTKSMRDSIVGLQSVREGARDAALPGERLWCAGFFYHVEETWAAKPLLIYEHIKRCLSETPASRPLINDDRPHVLGPNYCGDSANLAFILDYEKRSGIDVATARGYRSTGFATAVFLSALLEHIAAHFKSGPSAFTDLLTDVGIPQLDPATFDVGMQSGFHHRKRPRKRERDECV